MITEQDKQQYLSQFGPDATIMVDGEWHRIGDWFPQAGAFDDINRDLLGDAGQPARKLTPEERLLLAIRAAGLPEPEREVIFAWPRRWRFDFCWDEPHMVAVEVDGGVWSGGRHVRGKGYTEDCVKLNEAALLGWTVLRVTPEQVDDGSAVAWIGRALGGDNVNL